MKKQRDYLRELWQLMDTSDAKTVFMETKDEQDKPIKAILLIRGADTIEKYKEFHRRMEQE